MKTRYPTQSFLNNQGLRSYSGLGILFVLILTLIANNKTFAQAVDEQDSLALVALFNSTDGPNWNADFRWDLSQPVSSWQGVSIESSRVVKLEISLEFGLDGPLAPQVGDLSQLRVLQINANKLQGTLPVELGKLTELEDLFLNDNLLYGQVPQEITDLPKLSRVDFNNNAFVGELKPFTNLKEITHLIINNNKFSGEIPAEITELDKLVFLRAGTNKLSGELPEGLDQLTNLTTLLLNNNMLSGELPEELSRLSSLESLDLSNNLFSGCIPDGFRDFCGGDVDFDGNDDLVSWDCLCNNASFSCEDCATIETSDIVRSCQIRYTAPDGTTLRSAGTYVYSDSIGRKIKLNLKQEVVSASDSLILVDLYHATNGPNWVNTWDLSKSVCSWRGVTLTEGRVAGINLEENGLLGSIPISLGSLDSLKTLYLSNNGLSGTIPNELTKLKKLEQLSLGINHLSGPLPDSIVTMESVRRIFLNFNQLSGAVPLGFGNLKNLELLQMKGNELTGKLPEDLSESSSLRLISFSSNQLSGCIPESYRRFCSGQVSIDVFNSRLQRWQDFCDKPEGSCPDCEDIDTSTSRIEVVEECSYLAPNGVRYFESGEYLLKSTNDKGCEFTFIIELTIENELSQNDVNALLALYHATDGDNWVNSWDIDSSSPCTWHGVTWRDGRVIILELFNNNLVGQLPAELGQLDALLQLYMTRNRIDGEIPNSLGQLNNLSRMNLSDNNLSGTIPSSLGNLSNLTSLVLEENQLSGEIPKELGNLSNLTRLDLQDNLLLGEIPSELGNLTSISRLELNNNQLSGEIPSELGDLSAMTSLFLERNQLSGKIPEELAKIEGLRSLRIYDNKLSGALPEELGTLSNLSTFWAWDNRLGGCIPESYRNFCGKSVSFKRNMFLANFENFCDSTETSCQNCNSVEEIFDTIISCDPISFGSNFILDSSGDYEYLSHSGDGCNVLNKLNLTITGSEATYDTVSACGIYAGPERTRYKESGDYRLVYTNQAGCDSVVQLNLSISDPINETVVVNHCGERYMTADGESFDSSGVYELANSGLEDCPSSKVLKLTLNPIIQEAVSDTICGRFFAQDGQVFDSSGVYSYQYISNGFCRDVELNLTVRGELTDQTRQEGNVLIAETKADRYQWYECSSDSLIAIEGATDSIFEATEDGNYTVIMSNDDCELRSDCFSVMVVSVANTEDQSFSAIAYPNPTNGQLSLEITDKNQTTREMINYRIINRYGQTLETGHINSEKQDFDLDYAPGIYYMQLLDTRAKQLVVLSINLIK